MMAVSAYDAVSAATLDIVHQMEAAVNQHDVDAMMRLCTDDVVWESTTPPDGDRFEGPIAVRAALEALFRESNEARFETEELSVFGESAALLWRYTWKSSGGADGHVRGLDLIRARDGRIAEMLAYVKG
jgi:ketosteroid isomerase-like protein